MANYPQFLGPDGVLRQQLILSTTLSSRFFTGTMPADTVDMQVSIRGAAFSSDPDFISFEGTQFTIPNPSAFPDGLQMLPGLNEVRVKSILTAGTATQEGKAQVYLSQEADAGTLFAAPSGIFLERLDSTVRVTLEGIESDTVVGYHFYASPQPGGGEVGYFRITPEMLISGDIVEVAASLATLTVDANVVVDDEGFHAAAPLFLRMIGTQEDKDDEVLATSFNEVLEVPETIDRLRVSTTVETLRQVRQFSFEHDRQGALETTPATLPHAALSTVPETDFLYYVATAVHLVDGEEFESHFSPEVLGAPLQVTPSVGSFPQVGRQRIVGDMVQAIFRSNPAVRVDPGSALRDTVIDPFSTEADRIRFIVDFLHNAQSFPTLLLVDDPTLSGESIPVAQSSYKVALREAFHLASDEAVQAIIDNAFDQLAANKGVIRDGGKRTRGEVTFYVTDRPNSTITRAIGSVVQGGGVTFRTTSTAIISPTGGGKNFNASTGRYFARAFIQADLAGSAGNLAPGQIRTVLGNTLNVQVTNESRTFGGTDRESNRDLAVRAMRALASVDSGTLQGYTTAAVGTAGVTQVHVIPSGHALMMRDRNDDGRHVGGKVDVYLRGTSTAQVTTTFAFRFDTRERQQFEPVGDLTNLRFRAVDPALSDDNPIIEVLDLPNLDLVFENASKGYVFDLTDVKIVDYNQVELSADHNDPTAHDLDDEIRGSYRYRTSNQFILPRQPVIEVTRFEGTRTGLVPSTIYNVFRASGPLELGRSPLAGDFLRVTEPLDSAGTTIPSADPIDVVGEEHVILDGIEYLNNLGANFLTVRVFNLGRTVEYQGPLSTGTRDFTFIFGDEVTPLGIQLTDGSQITEGQTVLVDYSHDENFTVTYTSNAVVAAVQSRLDKMSHLTADVLAKWAVEVPVDISATIALVPNTKQATVDQRVRQALARLFGTFGLGTPVRQSDILRVLDAVQGVEFVVTPLAKMVRGAEAPVTREAVSTDTDTDGVLVSAWSSPSVDVYLLVNPLLAATTNAGGESHEFRGVFQDEVRLTHHEVAPNVNGFPIRGSVGGAFIIGADGLNIPGYSDNATIEANNILPADADAKEAEILRIRKTLTANRVAVSLTPGETPQAHDYAVTYVVGADTGAKNIEPGPIEYLVVGELNFVYDEAT